MRFRHIFAAFLLSLIIMALLLQSDKLPEPELVTPQLVPDLDSYLHEQESRFPDLRPGTEKKIVWHNSTTKTKTSYSIIYLHGFSASRQEIAPLCDLIAQELQANLFYTRLTGHGRGGDAMGKATLYAWKQDAVDALAIGEQIGDKVIIIGTSTGGTLATWLTHHDNSSCIAALVLLSPNFGPQDKMSYLLNWPGAEFLAPIFMGKVRSWRPQNTLQAQYWTTRYPSVALFPMMQLVGQVIKLDFEEITVPTLFIYSENDKVVDFSKTDDVYEQFPRGNRDILKVNESGDPSNHILAGDVLSPENTKPLADEIVYKLNRMVH